MVEEVKEPQAVPQDVQPQMIKLLLELGPLVIFFLVNARGQSVLDAFPSVAEMFGGQPLIFATAVFMVAMAVSLFTSWAIFKRLAIMPLVTGAVVLVFGTLTIYFQDATFIKMKPTIVNILFGSVLLGGMLFGQSLLKYVFGEVYKLKAEGWTILTLRWGIFFFVLAVLNEIVWRNFSDDFWVAFKVWGIMPLTIVFSMFQLPVLNKFASEPPVADKNAD
jgi:intracellular septation protein